MAGHTQMDEECASGAAQQQVFTPALQGSDGLAVQLKWQVSSQRQAQFGNPADGAGDGAALVAAYAVPQWFYRRTSGRWLEPFASLLRALALEPGAAVLHLRGTYFAVLTFGMTELIRHAITYWEKQVTGTVGRVLSVVRV